MTCWRCGRPVPSDEPLVVLRTERAFHTQGGHGRAEPAGGRVAFLCLRCDVALWPAVCAPLPPSPSQRRADAP